MSTTGSFTRVTLPGTDDIRKIVALLREDLTSEVRAEAADRLVVLAGNEPHPRAKAALLERAAKLVVTEDQTRAVMLLRESFRLFPSRDVGALLRDNGQEEASLHRLGRMSSLFDAIAALADDENKRDAFFAAARFHLGQGHGHRAKKTLAVLESHDADDRADELEELRKQADAKIAERDEALTRKRKQIVEVPDEFRARTLFEYAQLLLQGDEPLDDASAVLEDCVDQGIDQVEAAPLWAEVARAVGEQDMLARALAACLNSSEHLHEKMRHADELANLSGIDERTPALAQIALATLLDGMPGDIALRARLLSIRARGGDDSAEMELDKLRLAAVKERDRVAEAAICLALARLANTRNDLEKVERHLRRVRTLDPRNVEALNFFEARYRDAEDHQRLFLVLTHRLAISAGKDVVRIALEMAQLAEGPLDNAERAIEAYHRVLAAKPDHPDALQRLESLYRGAQRWDAVAELLDRRARGFEARAGDDADAAASAVKTLESIAALHREDGGAPDARGLLEAMRRVHEVDGAHAEAADYLRAHYRRDGRWRRLAKVLQRQLDHQKEASERASTARELYELQRDKLGDAQRATAALEIVVANAPDDLSSLRLLEEAYRRTANDTAYRGVLNKIRPLVEGDELVRLLEELSALTENAGENAEAVALYEALNDARNGHMAARRALTRLYGTVGRHEDLAELLDVRLTEEDIDPSERAELYEQLARTAAEHLDDMKRAEDAARALRKLRPDSQIGTDIAERAMVARGEFTELRGVYGSGADGAKRFAESLQAIAQDRSDETAVRCLLAAATAIGDELQDAEAAAMVANQALERATDIDDPELTAEAANVLLSAAEAADRSDLQGLAVAILVENAEGEERLMFMAQRVALCEATEDWDGAYAAVTALLAERLSSGDIAGLGGAAERVADLAERVEQEDEIPLLLCSWSEALIAQYDGDGDNAEEIRTATAELLERASDQALFSGEGMEEIREQIDNGLAAFGANEELLLLREQACTELGDWKAVVDTLEQRAAIAEGEDRIDLLTQAAARADSAGDNHAKAASLYKQVVDARPDSAEAWTGWLDALRGAGDEDALAEAATAFLSAPVDDRPGKAVITIERLGQMVDSEAAGADVNAILLPRLAEIAGRGALLEAEEGLLAIAAGRLDLEDGALELARGLRPAARAHGRGEDVLRCYEILAGEIDAGSEAHIEQLLDMASLADGELGDRAKALSNYVAALVASGGNPEVFEKGAAFAADDDERATLAAAVLALVDAGGNDEIEPISDESARAALLRASAEEAQGRDDSDGALQAWTLLRAADPKSVDALDALEILYREQEDDDAVAFVLEERLGVITDDEDREGTWLRLVSLHIDDRNDANDGLDALTRAVADRPDSEALAAMHLEALREHGEAEALVASLDARAAAAEDEDERRLLQTEAAQVTTERLDKPDDALMRWTALAVSDPTDDMAAENAFAVLAQADGLSSAQVGPAAELTEVVLARDEHGRADRLLTLRVEAADGDAKLAIMREQLALRETKLDDREAAFATATAALQLAPRDDALFAAVQRLAADGDEAAKLSVMAARAGALDDPAKQAAALLEHARLAGEIGEDKHAAASWQILATTGDNDVRMEAAAALAEIHERAGDSAALAKALLMQRDLAEDDDTKVALSVLAAEQLVEAGARAEAVAVLRNAEETAPADVAVWSALAEQLRDGDDAEARNAHLDKGWRTVHRDDPDAAQATVAELIAAQTDSAARWITVRDALEAGLRSEEVVTALEGLAEDGEDETTGAALDRLIAWHAGNEAPELAVALRLDRLERFPNAVDGRKERAAIARVFETELDDSESAMAQWQTLVVEAPQDGEAVTELLRIAKALDQTADAEELLAAAAGDIENAEERRALRLQLAQSAIDREDAQTALELLDQVLAEDPQSTVAWLARGVAIDGLADDARKERLTAHLEHGIAHAPGPDEKRAARLQLADHKASDLDDSASAFQLIADELAEGGDDLEDLYRLAEAYGDAAELTEPLWTLLETEAKSLSGDEANDRWLTLAMRAVEHKSGHRAARRYAERAQDAGGDADVAIAVLDQVYDAGSAVDDDLIDRLVAYHSVANAPRAAVLLQSQADNATSKKARIKSLTRLADFAASEVGRESGLDALAPLRSLALVEPTKARRWQKLRAMAGDDRAGDALDTVMQAFEDATKDGLRHDLLNVAADVASDAGDAESAAGYLRMALDEVDKPTTRKRLRELLGDAGQDEELAIELEQAAERDPDKAVQHLEGALALWLDKVGDAERGMLVLDRLLEAAPDRIDLADRRLDVMRLNGHDGYGDALEKAVASARDSDDAKRLASLLAKLLDARGETLKAAQRFALMNELAGLSASTEALAAFVDVMASEADELETADARKVFGWLLDNVEAASEPDRYAGARLQQLGIIDDEAEQLIILDNLVVHATENMADPDSAIEWAARALLLDAGNDDRIGALLDLAKTGEADSAIPALQAAIGGRDAEALLGVDAYVALLGLDATDEDSQQLLLTRCVDAESAKAVSDAAVPMLRDAGQHRAAADLARAAIEHQPAAERGPALVALATSMANNLGEPAEGIALLTGALASSDDADALLETSHGLATEHNAIEEWLAAIESQVADGTLTGDIAQAAVARGAAVALDDIEDPVRAADLWTRIWDADPENFDARDMVLAMRRAAADAEQLSADLERAVIQGGPDIADLSVELAVLCHEELGRSREALSTVRTVLRRDPNRDDALLVAEQLTEDVTHRRAALALLETAYRNSERWGELADVLRRIVSDTKGRSALKAIHSLADVQLTHLDAPKDALDSLTTALQMEPSARLLERSLKLARDHASAETPARLYDLALNGSLPADDRSDVLASAADHYFQERNEPRKAEELWRSLLENEPTHAGAYDGLDAIYESEDRWDELIALLEARVKHAKDSADEISILHRLGGIAQATNRNDVAIETFEQLVAIEPDDHDHIINLVELLRVTRNPRKLADALQKLADSHDEKHEKSRALTEAGHLYATRLEQPDRAEKLFVQAFDLDPGSDEAFKWLETRLVGNSSKLQRLYQHRSSGVDEGAPRTRVLRKLAALYSEAGRGEQARAVLEKAREGDQDNEAIDEDLLLLCEKHGDSEGFEDVAKRRLQRGVGKAERAQLLEKLTKMALDHGGDASKWLDRLREVTDNGALIKHFEGLVHASSEDPETAAQGLESVIKETSDPGEQAKLLEQVADLYLNKLDRQARAITAYQRILKLDAKRYDIQRKLADIFRDRGSHEALVETLRKWLSAVDDAPSKVPILAEIGGVQLELGQTEAGTATLEQAYEIDRNTMAVNAQLAGLLHADGATERAAEMQHWVVDQLRRERKRDELPTAATLAGEMYVVLGQHKQAQRFFRTALQANKGHIPATLGLGTTYLDSGNPQRAMTEFEKVARLPARKAEASDRAAAYVGVARCWLAQSKRAQARAAINKALALQADNKDAIALLSEV